MTVGGAGLVEVIEGQSHHPNSSPGFPRPVSGYGACFRPAERRVGSLSRIVVRDMLSWQSLMPAGAGTPRYENWVHWLMEGSGVVCATHPAPSWGEAPALHFSFDSRREPAIFVPITKWVTGITMVLRRSHLGDEKRRTLAGTTRANCRRALGWGRDPALHFPLRYRP